MNYGLVVVVAVAAVAMILTFNVSLVLTDHTEDDCSVIVCPQQPQFKCPGDSLLKSSPSTEGKKDNKDNDDDEEDSNPFDRLAAAGLIEELEPIVGHHIRLTSVSPSPSHSNHHHVNKRSLRYRQREIIKIVPGDYRNFEPDFYKFPFNHHQTQRKFKRDLIHMSTANNTTAASVDVFKRCCPEFQCICKPCQAMPICAPGYVTVEAQLSLGLPGSCCHKYDCVPTPSCANSDDDDGAAIKQQPNTTSYWRDQCTKCDCFNGQELCQQLCVENENSNNCFSSYLNRPVLNGETWLEDNDCTECRCIDGERRCQTSLCPATECVNPIKLGHLCCKVCPATPQTESPVTTSPIKTLTSSATATTTSSAETNTESVFLPSTSSSSSSSTSTSTSSTSPTLSTELPAKGQSATSMETFTTPPEFTKAANDLSTSHPSSRKSTTTPSPTVHINPVNTTKSLSDGATDDNPFLKSINSSDTSPTSPPKRIRNIFLEVDWIVVLALALIIISALTIAFLVGQSRQRKKKIYSTIPSSDSSLSQTSTVILTV